MPSKGNRPHSCQYLRPYKIYRSSSSSSPKMASCSRIFKILLISFILASSIYMIAMSEYGKNRLWSIADFDYRWFRLQNNGYITTKFGPATSGRLGNYLFELLSLVGIADEVGRIPYIEGHHKFLNGNVWLNIQSQFPSLVEQFKMFDGRMNSTMVQFHGKKCCMWDDPERLKDETDDYIKLDGRYFQSYKYFDHMREQVREWLFPGEEAQARMQNNIPSSFKDRFLICVHIRREDFVRSKQKDPSDAEFSVTALNYLLNKYSEPRRKMGGIIMGNEVVWERATFGHLPQVHIVTNSTPEEDFALSRVYCDVVLITAPSSSFGWFLGYLSKSMDVYYRDINNTNDRTINEMKSEDFFLQTWTKLRYQNETIVEVEEKSHKT